MNDTRSNTETHSLERALSPIIKITKENCPLSCPMSREPIWDAHPRVYLAIEETGKAVCPYCGAQYILESE